MMMDGTARCCQIERHLTQTSQRLSPAWDASVHRRAGYFQLASVVMEVVSQYCMMIVDARFFSCGGDRAT